jgi:phenylacetate-CoA ligase
MERFVSAQGDQPLLTPLQVLIPHRYDLLYQQMRSAYEGDTDVWRRVTMANRDAMVDYAARQSPYYQGRLEPGTPFEEIPLLTKALIREHHESMVARDAVEARRHVYRTAGSTGEPLAFLRDTAQMLLETVASDRFFRWLHGVPFDATIVAVNSAGGAQERFDRLSRGMARVRSRLAARPLRDPWMLSFAMLDARPEGLQRHLDLWGRLGSYFFLGPSSGIAWIAEQIEERGLRLRRHPVAVITTGDTVTEPLRARIERVFGVPVHGRYGSNEFPFLAATVPGSADRYLFNPLLAHVEVLGDDGRPVRPGEVGKIVLTDLNNRVMPLIRYVQGDLAVASERWFAGGFPLIERIVGRESEILRFPSGRQLSGSDVDKLLFKRNDFRRWVRAFQCIQTKENELELRVIWGDESPEVAARIEEVVRSAADPDTAVRVRGIEQLGRYPSGKVWLVRPLGSEAIGVATDDGG